MDRNLKIGLYTIGGLILASGIFFGIRAIVKGGKKGLSDAERIELEELRKKALDGTLTNEERQLLDKLQSEQGDVTNIDDNNQSSPQGQGDVTQLGMASFPISNGERGKQVAQIQLAINKRHSNGSLPSGNSTWACSEFNKLPLSVDGDYGSNTGQALGKYYGLCESSGFLWEVCDCKHQTGNISEGLYNQIISGIDVSDEALAAAGYSGFSGFDGRKGRPNVSRPGQNRKDYVSPYGQLGDGVNKIFREHPVFNDENNFSGYSNFNVPGYGQKQPSVLGDFYKGKYDFVNDNREKGPLQHSYGMGLFFSGNN
tara:strand:+ start:350 stop:1288 length:939 start_codon:yes stop_codon:yes gene_type:complete